MIIIRHPAESITSKINLQVVQSQDHVLLLHGAIARQ